MTRRCYARVLGDCVGKLEDEHYFPRAVQRLIGPVTVAGFPWQEGIERPMLPSTYAHGYIICRKHHDDLDGPDAIALTYFKNLTLIAAGTHPAERRAGRLEEITPIVDGRALERWFLKTICGAIACEAVQGSTIRTRWVKALFGRIPWPEEWAYFVIQETDAPINSNFRMEFRGAPNAVVGVESLVISAFGLQSLLSLRAPDPIPLGWLRRPPKGVGVRVKRAGEPESLGLPDGAEVAFTFRWA